MCFSRTDASIDMQYDLLGVTRDLTWPWPEVKFWHWPFKVNMYIFLCVSTRGTRCCQNYVTSFLSLKVVSEKPFLQKSAILPFFTSVAWPVEVKSFLTTCQRNICKRSIECFFPRHATYNRFWVMKHFRRNNMTLRQIWPLVTSGDLNIDLREKMTEVLSKVG